MGFGPGCVVSRAGVCGGVVSRLLVKKAPSPPPLRDASPTQKKTSIKLGQRLVYVVSTASETPPPPPKSRQHSSPRPGTANGDAPNVCRPTWGVSLCISPFSLKLIFQLVILISVC